MPIPTNGGADWGEKDLIRYVIDAGFPYFVQFHARFAQGPEVIARRNQAADWLHEQGIPFKWVGGRSNYEFAFRTEEDATMFKLAYG